MEAKEGIEERKEHKQKGNKLCKQKKSNKQRKQQPGFTIELHHPHSGSWKSG